MNLIIFDIDGTLTQTTVIDTQCFVAAVQEQLQVIHFNTNWHDYRYSTDSGILYEIYSSLHARSPSHAEVEALRLRFITKLQAAHQKNKSWFAAIPGATTLFSKIKALGNWHVGIATGTWHQAALFKLQAAAIGLYHQVPTSSADDHVERFELINKTIMRAKEQHFIDNYQRLIYVGDKSWDYNAAYQLSLEFIGIGNELKYGLNPDLWLEHYDGSNADALLSYLQSNK